jgi:hypothetical protein
MPKPRPSIDAVGVGHNEHSASHVCGTQCARRYAIPFRIIPDVGQFIKELAEQVFGPAA